MKSVNQKNNSVMPTQLFQTNFDSSNSKTMQTVNRIILVVAGVVVALLCASIMI